LNAQGRARVFIRGAVVRLQAVVDPVLVIGWNGMRPADHDELMLKCSLLRRL
jgi:hypothetical protein